jgi:hypothetical protein
VISAAITLCVASQRVFIVAVYFVIDSVQKLSDTLSWVMFWCGGNTFNQKVSGSNID